MTDNNSNRGALVRPAVVVVDHWQDLIFPDGTHSGARINTKHLVLEVQKRNVKVLFDLRKIIDFAEQACYNSDEQITADVAQ